MKKAGIVGGLGPVSTIDYYKGIIDGCREKYGSERYPEIVINSVDMPKALSFVASKNWEGLSQTLLSAIAELQAAGADFAAIASNTPHIVFDRVQESSPLPLISIIEETCLNAQAQQYETLIVLGTISTMGSGLYSDAFRQHGISGIVPSKEEQQQIQNIIFPKLEEGIVDPADKQKMLQIANRLIADHDADALVLGCTELPLMIQTADIAVPLLNTAQIHIEAIVEAL